MQDDGAPARALSVAVIGLGDLGGAIANRVAASDHVLRAFDRNAELAGSWGEGAACPSPAVAAAGADAVIAVVGNDAQLREVARDVLAARPLPRLIIVHSTVHPDTVREVGAAAAEQGVALVDAPVTGGRPAVEHGVLTAFTAGDPAAIAAATPVLALYCRTMDRVGPLGAGQIAKIANNAMSIINTLLAVEVVSVLEGLGMDAELVRQAIVAGGTGASRALSGTDASGFGTGWDKRRASLDPALARGRVPEVGIKDVGHALDLARSAGVETPLIAAGLARLHAFGDRSPQREPTA